MSNMLFGITIGAKDDTQSALRGAMAGITRFAALAAKPITIPVRVASGTLGLLRDINLGLRPLIAGMDGMIERGSALEVVRKSFMRLNDTGVKGADAMAAALVRASRGMLTMSRAMQIANDAVIAPPVDLEHLPKIFEFAAKKAATTGGNIENIINGIMSAAATGRVRALQQMGLLMDGLDAVKRTFDARSGTGSFDALAPSAQRVEILRAAMTDMDRQVRKMGVSGRETSFVWAAFKNQISDATDKLIEMVVKSDALRNAVRGAADLLRGLSAHFAKGVGFGEVLFGDAGLFGVIKSALMDGGEQLGRGILAALLDGAALIADPLEAAWQRARASLDAWSSGLFSDAKTKLIDPLKGVLDDALRRLPTWMGGGGGAATGEPDLTPLGAAPSPAGDAWRNLKSLFDWSIGMDQFREAYGNIHTPQSFGRLRASAAPVTREGLMATSLVTAALGAAPVENSLADAIRKAAQRAAGGSAWSRTLAAGGAFMGRFGQAAGDAQLPVQVDPNGLGRTQAWRDARFRRLRQIEQEREAVERGDRGVRRDAGARANAEIAALQRQGFAVTDRDRARIRARHEREVREERLRQLREEEREIVEQLHGDARARVGLRRQRRGRWGDGNAAAQAGNNAAVAQQDNGRTEALLEQVVAVGQAIAAALGIGERELAAIGARKA